MQFLEIWKFFVSQIVFSWKEAFIMQMQTIKEKNIT